MIRIREQLLCVVVLCAATTVTVAADEQEPESLATESTEESEPGDFDEALDQQTDVLIEELKDTESPLIVMGDFNSHWDQKRSYVRQLAENLELAAYEPQNDHLGTYKSTDGKRLDWILVSGDLAFSRYEVLPDRVSDHLAVYAELSLTL